MMSRRAALLASVAALPGRGSQANHEVDLFERGFGGVHTYRIPALIETGGILLAVADARHKSEGDLPGEISLVLRSSPDLGRTWSPIRTLVSVPEGGAGDASLLLDPRGRVWCFYAYGPPGIGFRTAKPGKTTGPDVLQIHAIVSADRGNTWSKAVDLTPQIKDPSWHACFVTSGTHFVVSSGRFLLPTVVLDGDKKMTCRNAYSDDGGATWHTGSAVAADTDESKVIEVRGGAVLVNARNGPRRLVGLSRDGGVTFRETRHDPALIDPGCNAGLARYRYGRHDLVLFTNAASARRETLTIKASADGGRSWSAGKVIHAGPAAYSTVIPLTDGSIGVLYERGNASPYERITFARLTLDWVLGR